MGVLGEDPAELAEGEDFPSPGDGMELAGGRRCRDCLLSPATSCRAMDGPPSFIGTFGEDVDLPCCARTFEED